MYVPLDVTLSITGGLAASSSSGGTPVAKQWRHLVKSRGPGLARRKKFPVAIRPRRILLRVSAMFRPSPLHIVAFTPPLFFLFLVGCN